MHLQILQSSLIRHIQQLKGSSMKEVRREVTYPVIIGFSISYLYFYLYHSHEIKLYVDYRISFWTQIVCNIYNMSDFNILCSGIGQNEITLII